MVGVVISDIKLTLTCITSHQSLRCHPTRVFFKIMFCTILNSEFYRENVLSFPELQWQQNLTKGSENLSISRIVYFNRVCYRAGDIEYISPFIYLDLMLEGRQLWNSHLIILCSSACWQWFSAEHLTSPLPQQFDEDLHPSKFPYALSPMHVSGRQRPTLTEEPLIQYQGRATIKIEVEISCSPLGRQTYFFHLGFLAILRSKSRAVKEALVETPRPTLTLAVQ